MRKKHVCSMSLSDGGALNTAATYGNEAVLLICADGFVRELLSAHLRAAGCFPMAVATTDEGRRVTGQVVPDLVLVDLDDHRDLKKAKNQQMESLLPTEVACTVWLSSEMASFCDNDASRCDADLCVAKPFEPRELLRQLLKLIRTPQDKIQPLPQPTIELESQQPTVRFVVPGGKRALDLSWREHLLLQCLLASGERARSRQEIRDAVWGHDSVDMRTVDQYVRRLRSALGAAGAQSLVKTVRGFGYAIDLAAMHDHRQ